MPKYQTPGGSPIVGVLETVRCRADIHGIAVDGGSVEYAGNTEVFWDEEKPVIRNGSYVFLDADGEEWTFDQLVQVEAEEEEAA